MIVALFVIAAASEPTSAPSAASMEARSPIEAQSPLHSLVYTSVLGLRLNPLGASESLRVAYRFRMFDSDSPLFRPANLTMGVLTQLTPAFARFGPSIEISPIAVWQLSVSYEIVGFFGSFAGALPFSSPNDNVSDAERARLEAAHVNRPMLGGVLTISNLLQAKVGPIAVRVQLQFFRYDMQARASETVFYDPNSDMLVPVHGFFLTQDTDLLYVTRFGLIVGARHTLAHAFYGEPAPRVSPGFGNLNSQHRLGPIALYEFFDKPGARFNRPAVALIAQWFLQHRYRTGFEVTQALPQIILAFLFQGQLWKI